MEILGIVLLVPLAGITVIALFAAINLLLPHPVEKTRLALEASLGRALLLGVINFTFFALLATGFFWLAQNAGDILGALLALIAGAILLGLIIFALLGLSASAVLLGERIGNAKSPFRAQLRGGLLMLLAGSAPYIGWFLFAPLVIWMGLGAAISALIPRRKKPPTAE